MNSAATQTDTTSTIIFALLLSDSQLLARFGSGELTVAWTVCAATEAFEAEQITATERDRMVNVATSWESAVH